MDEDKNGLVERGYTREEEVCVEEEEYLKTILIGNQAKKSKYGIVFFG